MVADVCLCTTYDCNFALNFASFILIACDGLWKVFSVEEATKFIVSVLEVRIRVYLMTWNDSLVSMPFPSLVFDCLEFSIKIRRRKTSEIWSHAVTSGSQMV